ncbi:hypothetical protein EJ05DRAFT_21510 [Pseudovirgaria hyperparasitica]|uniref:Secreted protein n=1 Tax=Pseudovirgaria hyperparasitica TaxID=470096 RepID=A0A6A6WL79_9PEZI|nr:uncharacterized protein EJ05DRAFT_21510 [Pseudovirgaria hyperparasitica]KAF2762947.1 hypothetical protein EJ05DRAFT_21510 [Pseudovirgaria hyperparasitica]
MCAAHCGAWVPVFISSTLWSQGFFRLMTVNASLYREFNALPSPSLSLRPVPTPNSVSTSLARFPKALGYVHMYPRLNGVQSQTRPRVSRRGMAQCWMRKVHPHSVIGLPRQ